eukprot:scaffold10815_cov129-Isochrysis_galbana.AAC.1
MTSPRESAASRDQRAGGTSLMASPLQAAIRRNCEGVAMPSGRLADIPYALTWASRLTDDLFAISSCTAGAAPLAASACSLK